MAVSTGTSSNSSPVTPSWRSSSSRQHPFSLKTFLFSGVLNYKKKKHLFCNGFSTNYDNKAFVFIIILTFISSQGAQVVRKKRVCNIF